MLVRLCSLLFEKPEFFLLFVLYIAKNLCSIIHTFIKANLIENTIEYFNKEFKEIALAFNASAKGLSILSVIAMVLFDLGLLNQKTIILDYLLKVFT
jgi:hypothetical protein